MGDFAAIDEAMQRLILACDAADLPPIQPAPRGADRTVDGIVAAIAPLRLPAEVERFWRSIDPMSIPVFSHPRLTDPEFALHSWRSHVDEYPGMVPRQLFPVSYQSHSFLLAELADDGGHGGPLYGWAYADDELRLCFAGLASYLDLLATMVELRAFSWGGVGAWADGYTNGDEWDDAADVRLAAALRDAEGGGPARVVPVSVAAWPEHWRRADGFTPEWQNPRGATTTIARLLDEAERTQQRASGRIHARVTHTVGSGAGRRLRVDDGTKSLDLWCPSNVCGALNGGFGARGYEFDVVVRPGTSGWPEREHLQGEIAAAALAGDVSGAQELAARFAKGAFGNDAQAEATAIRPLG